MFNNPIEILASLKEILFFAFVPLNLVYFSLIKIDEKLDKKLAERIISENV